MSRKRRGVRNTQVVHHTYSMLKLECRYGHLLGRVIVDPPTYFARRFYLLNKGGGYDLPVGEKLSLACGVCADEGRGTGSDYQLSWSRMSDELCAEFEDTASPFRSVTLG